MLRVQAVLSPCGVTKVRNHLQAQLNSSDYLQSVTPSEEDVSNAIRPRRYQKTPECDREKNNMAEANVVEETIKRLSAHKGVEGILALTGDGIVIRSTLDSTLSTQYAGWVRFLTTCS